jgi:hypothetical protein
MQGLLINPMPPQLLSQRTAMQTQLLSRRRPVLMALIQDRLQ